MTAVSNEHEEDSDGADSEIGDAHPAPSALSGLPQPEGAVPSPAAAAQDAEDAEEEAAKGILEDLEEQVDLVAKIVEIQKASVGEATAASAVLAPVAHVAPPSSSSSASASASTVVAPPGPSSGLVVAEHTDPQPSSAHELATHNADLSYVYIYHMLYVFAHTRLLVHTRTCTTGHGVSFFEIRRLSLKSFSRRGLWVGLTTDSRQKLFPNPIPGTRSLDSLAHLARLNRLMCLIARSLNRSIT